LDEVTDIPEPLLALSDTEREVGRVGFGSGSSKGFGRSGPTDTRPPCTGSRFERSSIGGGFTRDESPVRIIGWLVVSAKGSSPTDSMDLRLDEDFSDIEADDVLLERLR